MRATASPRAPQILWGRLLLTLLLLAGLLAGCPAPVEAAGPVVTNANDSGAGSLRQAIASAPPGATVTFDPSLAGTTLVLLTPLTLTADVTIDGATLGQRPTLSGGDATRVLEVSAGATVTLRALVLAHGTVAGSGGAVANAGALRMERCDLFANGARTGGAISNRGRLSLTSCFLIANRASSVGGALDNWGTAELGYCALNGNMAATGSGGAIYNYSTGTLAMTECALADNTAGESGGAVANWGTLGATAVTLGGNSADTGGGILASSGVATIAQCTLRGNRAGSGGGLYVHAEAEVHLTNSTLYGNSAQTGGGVLSVGSLTVVNSTLAANAASGAGGGLHNAGTLWMRNSIVARSPLGGDYAGDGAVEANARNVVEDGSLAGALPGDPLLGPLDDHGGPTETAALLPGSPAINAGDDAHAPTTDQRGVARPQGRASDIGAYEANTGPVWGLYLPRVSR